MNILVTGAAGFVGYHLCQRLVNKGHFVFGIDNINDYYNPDLKIERLVQLGIKKELISYREEINSNNINFSQIDISDKDAVINLFKKNNFDIVINLAAQAGVRYSIKNPHAYINSNILGFLNILEGCRVGGVKQLLYASSSSVYGENKKVPFQEIDNTDSPVSLYAATKKSNELLAHSYSKLHGIKSIGMRFFTVYGPWGRPDMAYYSFAKSINSGEPIKVFNGGNLERDFTYIDDVIECLVRILEKFKDISSEHTIYNIGNNQTVKLINFIEAIENELGKKAEKIMLPMQPGDVSRTWADVDKINKDFGYTPNTDLSLGINRFISWFLKCGKKF